MAQLSDSGNRITYGEGMAIREPNNGKGRYELISPFALRRLAEHCQNGADKYSREDLIPDEKVPAAISEQIEGLFTNIVSCSFNYDQRSKEYVFEFVEEGTPDPIVRVHAPDATDVLVRTIDVLHCIKNTFPIQHSCSEDGTVIFIYHYDGGRNWERGMPYSRYCDSAMRHLQQFLMGMENEDHLAAAAWNIFALMHHQELGQDYLDDMPHYLGKVKE